MPRSDVFERQVLIDSGIALSRAIALDRVFPEVVQQLRRAIGCDACVIALADGDATTGDGDGAVGAVAAPLRVVHQVGYDEPGAVGDAPRPGVERRLEGELQPVWREAIAAGRVIAAHDPRGLRLTAPIAGPDGALGAMTVVTDDVAAPRRRDEAERALATIAAQTAAAIDRARLVRRVEHRRRLEAVGEVAASVAHELRNPLFAISSAAQLLRFRTREDPVVEKNVGRILREVERLNRVVTALLDVGRPGAIHTAPGDPDAVWDDVVESHRGQLESRALQLCRTRPPRPARCPIDAERLAQLFANVLVNAIDAAPEASDLTLASTTLPNGAWRCRLTNGGPPIPPDLLPRVFEIFFSATAGGTGIGLAICQRIAEEHGGTIGIESTPDSGTTVTITLPGAGRES